MAAKFHCVDCDSLFDEPKIVSEYRGECFGFPAYENMAYCPYCGGDFEEYVPPTGYWVSASTATGELFGTSIEANDEDELFDIFRDEYPDCEICDYGRYDEEED